MSKVAALVSAYYCAQYLTTRIDNLLSQSRPPEILAVCLRGGLEEQIAKTREGVTVITTLTVPTIYGAWNKAIEETDADYLCVANSDDLHYWWAIERMQQVLDDNPDVALVYPMADTTHVYGGLPVGRFLGQPFNPETMIELCYMGPMPMWRRSLHEKYGLFDSQMEIAGDYEFWLRVALAGEKFLQIPEAVGCYLSRPDSREHREPIRTLWETARARSRYVKEPYGPPISPSGTADVDSSDHTLSVSGASSGASVSSNR